MLEKGKQPIYSLWLVELKTLKTHIETNLAKGFIKASKTPADSPILFVCKTNGSFCFCVNYWGLNNPIIKYWYPLLLIGKFLDQIS